MYTLLNAEIIPQWFAGHPEYCSCIAMGHPGYFSSTTTNRISFQALSVRNLRVSGTVSEQKFSFFSIFLSSVSSPFSLASHC